MTQTIAEAMFAEGRAEGRAEGEAKGQLGALKQVLRNLLEKKFSSLPEGLVAKIEAQTDLQALNQAVLQVYDLQRPEDLSL